MFYNLETINYIVVLQGIPYKLFFAWHLTSHNNEMPRLCLYAYGVGIGGENHCFLLMSFMKLFFVDN